MKKSNDLGWQCPICKTVYSPYIKECAKCTPIFCKFVITKNQIYDEVVSIITNDFHIPIRKTTASFYDDLGLDSLDCVEGIMLLELMGFSIGELIEMLPKTITNGGFENELHLYINLYINQGDWLVEYSDFMGELYATMRKELVDALYEMILRLKEEGVI